MALKKVKGNIDRLFDKNVTDLVRGIRNNRENEMKYISECLEEIRVELKSDNGFVKANAVDKLIYLQMLGYNIAWANFNIIEVMSLNRFTLKRIGYLAASQTFYPGSDLLMLTTNLIRKDITSSNQYEASLVLNAISCFLNADLARDLLNDILSLMNSSKPYIRKKAVLVLYKVFLKYPDSVKMSMNRLKEKLDDPDSGVQSAAVNVICELSRKNPNHFLNLTPIFFNLMTTSSNNWMLIKIIKLFRTMIPLDPKIAKNLIDPLTALSSSTSAMSLLYECINTLMCMLSVNSVSGLLNRTSLYDFCTQKLCTLIEDKDQNIKYLALMALGRLSEMQPKQAILPKRDLIINCLNDKDESIRMRALDLLPIMVSKKTLMNIVSNLMERMEKISDATFYRDQLLKKILEICSQNNYELISNFEWYITILIELSQTESALRYGHLIVDQLFDITIRVPVIRIFIVSEMADVLTNNRQTLNIEILRAAAWICGEYRSFLKKPELVLHELLNFADLSLEIQPVFLTSQLKIFLFLIKEFFEDGKIEQILELCDLMETKLNAFTELNHNEVKDRISLSLYFVTLVKQECQKDNRESTKEVFDCLNELFTGELNAVAPNAQKKVPVPEGLNLDEWINEPFEEIDMEFLNNPNWNFENLLVKSEDVQTIVDPESEEVVNMATDVINEDPNYLKNDSNSPDDLQELDIDIPLVVYGKRRSDRFLNKDNYSNIDDGEVVVNTELEMPEGYVISESPESLKLVDFVIKNGECDNNVPISDLVVDKKISKKKTKKNKNRKKDERKKSKKKEKNVETTDDNPLIKLSNDLSSGNNAVNNN